MIRKWRRFTTKGADVAVVAVEEVGDTGNISLKREDNLSQHIYTHTHLHADVM